MDLGQLPVLLLRCTAHKQPHLSHFPSLSHLYQPALCTRHTMLASSRLLPALVLFFPFLILFTLLYLFIPCSFCFLCPQALCPERHMKRKVSWETPGFTLKLGPHGLSGGDDLGGGLWQGSDCLACSSRALIQLRWGWEL